MKKISQLLCNFLLNTGYLKVQKNIKNKFVLLFCTIVFWVKMKKGKIAIFYIILIYLYHVYMLFKKNLATIPFKQSKVSLIYTLSSSICIMSTCYLNKFGNYTVQQSKVSALRICFLNCDTMIFKGVMSNQSQNPHFLFNPR